MPKQNELKPHPDVCPNCNESEELMYERFTLEQGEYVCHNCGWGMNALTGEITYEGDAE